MKTHRVDDCGTGGADKENVFFILHAVMRTVPDATRGVTMGAVITTSIDDVWLTSSGPSPRLLSSDFFHSALTAARIAGHRTPHSTCMLSRACRMVHTHTYIHIIVETHATKK